MAYIAEHLKPYQFHGLDLPVHDQSTKEVKTECVFCHHRSEKFYINTKTGLYSCKNCGESGNVNSFLTQVHKEALEGTNPDDYKELAKDRAPIPAKFFKDHGFALCRRFASPRWLIPIYNARGTLVNIRVYQKGKPILGTTGLPLYMGRIKEGLKGVGPVIICEGEWDALALELLRRRAARRASVISVPGCSTFKTEWRDLLNNREVFIAYDNDTDGQRGAERAASMLRGHASSVSILNWLPNTPNKWDVRDFVNQALAIDKREDYVEVWDELWGLFDKIEGNQSGPVRIAQDPDLPKNVTIKQIMKTFKNYDFHTDKSTEDAMVACLAVAVSIMIPGDPLWMFLVAPPGTGKTMLLEPFMRSPLCIFKSSLPPKALISGWQGEGGDPSLIPQLTGKCLVLKDYTEIMTMSSDEREGMYGVLRGAYDGTAEKTFGNGITRRYDDTYFSFIAAVTDVIHGDDRASLGERFLKFQFIDGSGYNPDKHIRAALAGMSKAKEGIRELGRLVAGFTSREIGPEDIPDPPAWVINRVVALSQLIALLRTTVEVNRQDEMLYRPVPEVGTRLAKQIVKFGQGVAIVLGKKTLDKEVWRFMEKLAFDTATGWNLDILRVVMDYNPKPVTKPLIEQDARLASTTCERRLQAMRTLDILQRKRMPTGNVGQPANGYTAADHIKALWKAAKVGQRT